MLLSIKYFFAVILKFFIRDDKLFSKIRFLLKNRRRFNINNPKTFNEKLAYLKIYNKDNIKTILADKLSLKKVIDKKIGNEYSIKTLFSTSNPSSIPFEKLPNSFIIKATHGSGWNIIIEDKNKANLYKIIKKCEQYLSMNYYYFGREFQYYDIRPRILIEELLLDSNGQIPNDYKFFAFNGRIKFIQVDIDRFSKHKRILFDENWNRIPVKYEFPVYEGNVKIPDKFQEMKGIVHKLTSDLNFARVDIFDINNSLYICEVTFTPEANIGSFIPFKYDNIFGKYLNIN